MGDAWVHGGVGGGGWQGFKSCKSGYLRLEKRLEAGFGDPKRLMCRSGRKAAVGMGQSVAVAPAVFCSSPSPLSPVLESHIHPHSHSPPPPFLTSPSPSSSAPAAALGHILLPCFAALRSSSPLLRYARTHRNPHGHPQDVGLRFTEGYVSLHNPPCLNFGGPIALECYVRLKPEALHVTGNEFGEIQVLISHGRPDTCEDGSVFLQINDAALQVGCVVTLTVVFAVTATHTTVPPSCSVCHVYPRPHSDPLLRPSSTNSACPPRVLHTFCTRPTPKKNVFVA